MATLQFIGATRQVTGSNYLLRTRQSAVLLECGMYQGDARTEALNTKGFPFDPRDIDAVVLSHAHLDHSGLLPRLVRQGFRGTIHTTAATADLLDLLLKDSAFLAQRDIEWENKVRRRAGRPPVEPLYTAADVEEALKHVETAALEESVEVAPGVELRFHEAGHILGAAIVELRVEDAGRRRRLVFSGDLGNEAALLLERPARIDGADVLLMESTYGDRDHRPLDATIEEFAGLLEEAHESGGNVLIPSFAVGRTQEILFLLGRFYQEGRLPQRAVFLDSPMAIAATEIHHRHMKLFNRRESDALARANATSLHAWLPVLRLARTPEESMAINRITGGAIIIAGSGMCTGGRIRHHLKYNLWRSNAHIVIVGFQAAGTPGRALVDGASSIRLLGAELAVRAKIHTLGGFSAHAGQSQLLAWLASFKDPRPRVYLVHGEPEKSEALAARIHETTDLSAVIPEVGQTIEL